MSPAKTTTKGAGYSPSLLIKAGAGVMLALLLPVGTGTVTSLVLSPHAPSILTKAPITVPGLLAELPPPVIPLPSRPTDKLFEILVPAKVIPRATLQIPPPAITTKAPATSPPATAKTPSTPTTTVPFVISSNQQLSLVPGESETGYLTVGALGSGTVRSMSFGVLGNLGQLGDVTVELTGCISTPWRSIAQAQGSCANPASTSPASLSQLEGGAVVEPTAGITSTEQEVFRVVFTMPASAGNNQQNQNQTLQEVIGLYQ